MSPATAAAQRFWPVNATEWLQVYDARQALAKKDPISRFFFELDWQTEPNLAAAAAKRGHHSPFPVEEWPAVAELLELRLRSHRARMRPGVSLSLAHVQALSEIVSKAVDTLAVKVKPVERVILAFGAGTHQASVPFGGASSPGRFLINDADSYYIWLFAEFGLQAIEFDVDEPRWKKLMPSLLCAGWLYSHRFPEPLPLGSYLRPGAALLPARVKKLERTFKDLWQAAGDSGKAFEQCLRQVTTG